MLKRGFIPSTGFGHRASLDESVRPFLGRVSRVVAVDYLVRGRVTSLPRGVEVLMSPGSSRILTPGSTIRETQRGLGELGWPESESRESHKSGDASGRDHETVWLTAEEVLRAQTEVAQAGWPLEFWCTPDADEVEWRRRVRLTLANAAWAREQEIGDLDLWGPAVGWDEESYAESAKKLASMRYATVVICGLWCWIKQPAMVGRIVEAVRETVGEGARVHVSGLCSPEMAKTLSAKGADSIDGASHVRAADRGVQWGNGTVLADGSRIEKTHMAIDNAWTIVKALEAGWARRGVKGS